MPIKKRPPLDVKLLAATGACDEMGAMPFAEMGLPVTESDGRKVAVESSPTGAAETFGTVLMATGAGVATGEEDATTGAAGKANVGVDTGGI